MFSSFSKFKLRITRIFGDIDEERTSERHIRALNQKGPASSYAAEFQQYANRTQWDNAALTAQFYQGLKDCVKDNIVRGDRPKDL